MVKLHKKFIATVLTSSLLLVPISNLGISQSIVYAQSTALTKAKSKVDHLVYSIQNNYLGLKNQATWEIYIKEARALIVKIETSEKTEKSDLTTKVNKSESLVKALARINHVEKSMTPKAQGGYGNYLGVKNVVTWNEYLRLAVIDLSRVDQNVFGAQYNELVDRMEDVKTIIQQIENKFDSEYERVIDLYNEAINTNDIKKAAIALQEAQNLETCEKSAALEKEIKDFISNNIW